LKYATFHRDIYMTIRFFPFGIPVSSSHAVSGSLALSTPAGAFPVSAALAEFAVNNIGPTGPAFIEINSTSPE
jgi:hypothetical protein